MVLNKKKLPLIFEIIAREKIGNDSELQTTQNKRYLAIYIET